MRVVKNLLKPTYGRPFFVCSDKTNPCSYWVWGDVRPITKPECRHGSPCVIRKVKKEGLNKDRRFFCCPNDKENSCHFFEWVPEEPTYAHYRSVNFFKPPLEKPSLEKPTEHYLTTEFINDFANNLAILGRCEASWGEPERDMTISTRLSDSVFTETHGLENALKSEYE